jgi:hypothetical protein
MCKKNFCYLSIFFISVIFSFLYLDYKSFNFSDISWLKSRDNISDFLALKFFLNDKWRFPLGLNPNYGDLDNSIVFSGSIPFLAFFFKIFKSFLPFNFHYLSFWIFIIFFFQLFFSYKIIFHFTTNYYFSLLGSIFFLLSPVFLERIGDHLSLGAHWIILACFYYEIKYINNNFIYKRLFLILFSSLVHFYFTFIIVFVSLFFLVFKFLKDKKIDYFFINILFIFSPLIILMFISGYFIIPAYDSVGFGFGVYKANFLTLIDPRSTIEGYSWSLIIPDIPNLPSEYEGFGYLGLGIIIFFIFCVMDFLFNFYRNINKYKCYLSIIFFFFILSISNSINISKFLLLHINLPDYFYALLNIIRSSGRLIWPVYYLIMIYCILKIGKFFAKNNILILLIFFLIQLVDIYPGLYEKFFSNKKYLVNEEYPIFKNYFKEHKTKQYSLDTTYPSNDSDIFLKISNLLIYENFNKTNFFSLGRYNRQELSKKRSNIYEDFEKKNLKNNTLYVIDNYDHFRNLKYLFSKSKHGFFFTNNLIFLLPYEKNKMSYQDIDMFNNIKFNKISVKKKYTITFKDKNGILGFGWSHGLESRGVLKKGFWTEGNIANIFFECPEYDQAKTIVFNLNNSVAPSNETLNLEIILNEVKIGKFKITDNFSGELKVKLDQSKLSSGVNKLQFNISNPSSLIEKRKNIDGRLLGIKLESLEIL